MQQPREARSVSVRPSVDLKVRPWALYLLIAVAWPIAVEALLAVEVMLVAAGHALGVSSQLLEAGIGILLGVGAALVAWRAGAALARASAPRGLRLVPALWAVLAAASAVFGLGIADLRDVYGFFGIVGAFVLGAVGFWIGISAETRSAEGS